MTCGLSSKSLRRLERETGLSGITDAYARGNTHHRFVIFLADRRMFHYWRATRTAPRELCLIS